MMPMIPMMPNIQIVSGQEVGRAKKRRGLGGETEEIGG